MENLQIWWNFDNLNIYQMLFFSYTKSSERLSIMQAT